MNSDIGPPYAAKTIELCAPGDPICSDGDNGTAHTTYTAIGTLDQAATYAAGRV
jgi:cutinase